MIKLNNQLTYLRDIVFALSLTPQAKIQKETFWFELYFDLTQIKNEAEQEAYMSALEDDLFDVAIMMGVDRVLAFDQLRIFLMLSIDEMQGVSFNGN
jgi:hypothetical protein